MLAIAVGQLARMLDMPASSRAGSLPHWIFSGQETCVWHSFLCGSKACSRKRWVSWPGCWLYRPLREQARSRTGSSVGKELVFGTVSSVGAKLARDGGGSAGLDVGCAGLFAGKPAPTLDLQWAEACVLHRSPVGASLLAIAECQLAWVLDVPTPSRAGSLPHWFCASPQFPGHP